MANPSCIVESGKLSPVGQRNLAQFAGQNERRIIIVLMSSTNAQAGYFNTTPSADQPTAWMLPFREIGITVTNSANGLRSDTKAVIVLTADEWASRRGVGRFKDNIFQVWGDGGETKSWPVTG